jgi:cellulose synthase/poly-beta-1,6-N-acetylglucosamine synthase-like glycosyltransferase
MTALLLSLLFIPLLVVFVDVTGQVLALRALYAVGRHRKIAVKTSPVGRHSSRCTDYTLIVPIYGKISYLENVDYLRSYGHRVLLTTSRNESDEFYQALHTIAEANGFRTHISAIDPSPAERVGGVPSKRVVGGTLRDTIVRDAHSSITTEYVVCIDADTTTNISIDHLVGVMAEARLDLASVRLVPANRDTLLARLQGFEYSMAMRMRQLMPWLVSGGCHAARREVHRTLMHKHSLFFQGNDVELGLLATSLGYRVGHVPFVVPTTVPSTVSGWWRQRLAWAGGEFRLMVVNVPSAVRHPFLYLYGGVVLFGLLPFRYYYLLHPAWSLLTVTMLYASALLAANWRHKTWELALYPLYSLVYSLVLIPLGVVSYVHMAVAYRNPGIIRHTRIENASSGPSECLSEVVREIHLASSDLERAQPVMSLSHVVGHLDLPSRDLESVPT